MTRPRDTDNDTPGYDSFLDIVANLVGILVILIMVLGVRAKEAWKHVDDASTEATASTQPNEPSLESDPQTAHSMNPPVDPDDASVALASPAENQTDFILPPLNLDVTHDEPQQPDVQLAVQTPMPSLDLPDVDTPRHEAEEMRLAAHQTDEQIAALDQQVAVQKAYRDQLLVAQTAGQQQIRDYQEQLAAVEAERSTEQQDLGAAEEMLANLQQRLDRVDLSKPEPIVLAHRPSPLAKTVFGREEHFRLNARHLSYVPMQEVRELLKDEMAKKMWKLKETPQVRETVGPLGDFYVRYVLQRSERKIRTESGPLLRTVVGLDHFELLPVNETLGVPVSAALSADSEFSQRLSSYDPSEVTVTVWTYPDSYAELRQLKESLWQRGYLVAARPLPPGVPIGGSPDGSRSAAE